ncbi:hypothetical protein AQS8620_01293 [Aquimixticola soesokkakensis]|uniref:Uncharacterized protein n=1 Tax=Aquimixticola soesokkakensis TaxID=1519096 RepID=A0A1Y5SBB7_9RHOB|nr:phage tail protein [Aquimixticola soesokkakensis]SLN36452.1 hypothetical protein AQS8620_01293 [Aquimixticola soesokkakensis]
MSIRKSLLIASFLASTALTPRPAEAGPIAAFVVGGFSYFASAGVAAGLAAGTAYAGAFAAGASAAAFLGGSVLGRVLVGIGISAVSAALTNRTPQVAVSSPSERLVNYAQPVSYMRRGYGRIRTGGIVGFTGFANNFRHVVILVAAHTTKGPVTYYLDKTEVALDGGDILTEPFAGHGSIRPHIGFAGQIVDNVLAENFPEITAAHDFAGLSYFAFAGERVADSKFADVYPGGDIWNVSAVWDMCDTIYDPRDGLTKWTDNAALVIAHELVHTLGAEVDWDEVAIEADVCDALVTNRDGAQQRRWTINAEFTDDMEWDDVRDRLITACDGYMFERPDGKMGFRVGRWIEPTVTLTGADFVSFSVTDGKDLGTASQFVVRYAEPANDYEESQTGVYVYDDTARRITSETTAYEIDSHNQAWRVAQRLARLANAGRSIRATVELIGFELIGERFVHIDHAELGIVGDFEISKLVRNEDGLTFSLEAVATRATDFVSDASTEEPARPVYDQVESDDTVPDVTGLAGAALDGSSILWQWDAQGASLTQQLQLRSIEAGIEDWVTYGALEGQAQLLLSGLLDGASYEAQVRNRTSAGRLGSWSASVTVAAVANSTPPVALTAFAASADGVDGLVTFTAPNDPNYYATRIWRADYASGYAGTVSFADAALIQTEYGIPSTGDSYRDPALASGVYAYWGVPINASGRPEISETLPATASGPATLEII